MLPYFASCAVASIFVLSLNAARVAAVPPVVTVPESYTLRHSYYGTGQNRMELVDEPSPVSQQLTISDGDSTNLSSATVSISSGFQTEDMLAFIDQGGIVGSYDAATGVMSLTGTATLAAYETALRSVTYDTDPNLHPNSFTKSIDFQVVDDASEASNTASRTAFVTTAVRVYTDGTPKIITH